MLTIKLPSSINSKEEAISYLTLLHENGYNYHPDDPADQVSWDENTGPTPEEMVQLDKLMDEVFEYEEDPYTILMDLGYPPQPVTIQAYNQVWYILAEDEHVVNIFDTLEEAKEYCEEENLKITLIFN